MIQLHTPIDRELSEALEAYFCELENSPWMLRDDVDANRFELFGYFENKEDAQLSYEALKSAFPVSSKPIISELEDRDWKEAYKDHFKPWSHDNLHWVPTWEREQYSIPEGDKAVYLDPGAAFGTGNHETTRLCAVRLTEMAERWKEDRAEKSVLDVGCGSGILAISARVLGFGEIEGFDIDPDSVEIAIENAEANQAENIHFFTGKVEEALETRTADLVFANILANVLEANAAWLVGSVNPGGCLCLSGILAHEVEQVRRTFFTVCDKAWQAFDVETRTDGQWADLCFTRE